MNKSLAGDGQAMSLVAKSSGGHTPSARITDPLHRILLFSTPLLGRRGINMPAKRPDNDSVELSGRTSKNSSRHGPLKRSLSMSAKSRRNVVAVNRTHVRSDDARKSSCLLPGTGADAVPRYKVSCIELLAYTQRVIDNKFMKW